MVDGKGLKEIMSNAPRQLYIILCKWPLVALPRAILVVGVMWTFYQSKFVFPLDHENKFGESTYLAMAVKMAATFPYGHKICMCNTCRLE